MPADDTIDTASLDRPSAPSSRRLALCIAWCREEPWRVGEVLVLGRDPRAHPWLIGRGEARDDDPFPRARFVRQRPGVDAPQPPLTSAGLSRAQLVVRVDSAGARLENLGRRRLLVGGAAVGEAVLAPGDTAELENELLLLVIRRPETLPAARHWPESERVPFGRADRFGVVGESAAAWALRDELAFAAQRDPLHVLLLGATGTGKELAARAIAALGSRGRPLVARNAATLPSGLVEAELFGNVKDYPNPGMKARDGLIGAADGGVLFLDEIGELPEEQQAQLLRVLDAAGDEGGEYHRLGEDRARRSRFRLVGATNRSVERIKHDLLARMPVRIELPRLADRREDLPLIARHLVTTGMPAQDPTVMERFVEETREGEHARLAPGLVAQLLDEPLEHGVRELGARLWDSVRRSEGKWLSARPGARRPVTEPVDASALDEAQIRAALEANGGVVSRAYRALGLPSRHVLHRLMRKHDIER